MKPFKFNGDWEFNFQFDAFKNSSRKKDGRVKVFIKDILDDNPEPLKEQVAAINFISEHPQKIKLAVLKAVESFYPKMKKAYGYDETDEDDRKCFPLVESLEDYNKVFGVGNVFIHIPHKEELAYVGLECWCTWDDEHGLGILLHKDKLIAIDQANQAFNPWKAYVDNGTDEDFKNSRKKPSVPTRYKPHPKFNKFKPSQIIENDSFEYLLISHGYNQKFIELSEKGEIDINGKNKNRVNSFFEQACASNNMEIVRYMFEREVEVGEGIHRCINGLKFNLEVFEYLLSQGCDINKQDSSGYTVLLKQCQELAGSFGGKQQIIQYNWGEERLERKNEWIDLIKSYIAILIERGGDPTIKSIYGWDYYSFAKNLWEEYKSEMCEFIIACMDKANRK